MKVIRSHVLNGKRYWVVSRRMPDADGKCDASKKKITIAPELSDIRLMEVVIHEGIHSVWDHLSEDTVTRAAEDIARLLKRLGYERKVDHV